MKVMKKHKISKKEAKSIIERLDGYLWLAVDPERRMITAGDEYVADLRDDLLYRRCHKSNIFGLGINLKNGKIDHLPAINRRNPATKRGQLYAWQKALVEDTVHYFFSNLPCFSY